MKEKGWRINDFFSCILLCPNCECNVDSECDVTLRILKRPLQIAKLEKLIKDNYPSWKYKVIIYLGSVMILRFK